MMRSSSALNGFLIVRTKENAATKVFRSPEICLLHPARTAYVTIIFVSPVIAHVEAIMFSIMPNIDEAIHDFSLNTFSHKKKLPKVALREYLLM